ncbi:hypothetical protein GWK47_003356 [Chionoecetes opilio]|uniref:Uncharacterized protein n=1 Tax=Chionoecetes opilio TaxID=41210 RepID=A0A8J4YWU3_CHIOP|nr:hypothetical protein GWK47_003356 [Chionoecetes opilio]
MRLHSSQRKGPVLPADLLCCWETSPAFFRFSRHVPCCQREEGQGEVGVNESPRAEAEAKVCLELDRSVVLSGSYSAGSSSDSSASSGNSPTRPLRRAHEGNVFNDGDDERPSTSAHTPKRMRASVRKSVLNSELAAALDRTKVSNRNAVNVLSAAARNLGHDPAELC